MNNIKGPVVLVGHSYGGQVITNAARETKNVKSLVYVAAFAPDAGEAAAELAGKFPGSTLGEALAAPVKLADGNVDLSIEQSKFHQQFAHDVSAENAALMAAGQRPVTEAALTENQGLPPGKHCLLTSFTVTATKISLSKVCVSWLNARDQNTPL